MNEIRHFSINRFSLLSVVLWTVLLLASLLWNLDNIREQIMQQAYASARANLNKDITFRRWGTSHGGVYVPITDTQKPVPWLAHIPGRDVTTDSGKKLTLLNPATMLRQMMDQYTEDYGIRGRITGLRYLNPGNKPDAWEEKQLKIFERGEKKEVWDITQIDRQPYLRYLRAMYMEPGCEKCHAILGYKLGDMRGATGLNLPLASYYEQIRKAQFNLTLSHSTIWLLGLAGIGWGSRVAQERRLEHEKREQEKAEAAENLRIYANAFEKSGEAILITDSDNHVVNINAAFTRLTGYSAEESLGHDPKFLASNKTSNRTYQEMWTQLGERGFWQGEIWDKNKAGHIYPIWIAISAIRDESGQAKNYIASFADISERKAAEARIEHLAHHDILTGLYNRFSLQNRLEQAIFSARREDQQVAVFFIDMDRFKDVNDSLGHNTGDLLLKEVASRLTGCVRESDIVARIGGDEFVIVLTGMRDSSPAMILADEVLRQLTRPYEIDGRNLLSSPSIGISIFPADGANESELIKNADVAMYHAKEQGRNNYQFFSRSLLIAAQERLAMEQELRAALTNHEFELHYQPKIYADNNDITGLEALVRWHHPEKGLVPPDKFIPITEDTGMINELGSWVLDEACRQLSEWKKAGFSGIHMAVNLSTKQLQSDAFAKQVESAIEQYQLENGELEFEITETAAMNDPELAVERLQALRQLGVTLAIDDFGTGYSSLAYLKRLPIQVLKLDRTFVRDIEFDRNDAEICMATLALAHNIGLKVVAEGVETRQQHEFLIRYQCDYLQGYYFSPPVNAAEATEIIRKNAARRKAELF